MEKKQIPVYFFDEHNEAFYYWHKARHEGFMDKPLDLVHVDAHDDMAMKDQLKRSLYFDPSSGEDPDSYYRRLAENELEIANFIRPAVLTGVIKNVFVVFPAWRNIKKGKNRKTSVCSVFGDGMNLRHGVVPEGITEKAFPDLVQYRFKTLHAGDLPKNRRVILDIDMDYFACRDSIFNTFSFTLDITREQFEQRHVILKDKGYSFSGLEFSFHEEDGNFKAVVSHRKSPEKVHLPDQDEIRTEMKKLFSVLQEKRIRPAMITVSRSCYSGYCPEDYVEFIESELKTSLEMFTGVFIRGSKSC